MKEAQQALSSREFAEWMAFDRLSPIGPDRLDWMLAQVAWRVALSSADPKKAPPKFEQFLPPWLKRQVDTSQAARDPDELWTLIEAQAAVHNARIGAPPP